MISPRHNKLQIPIELSRYVYQQGLITPFSIYLYLKLFSDGKLYESSPVLQQMKKDLRVKDNRTFKKHISKLISLGWIGYKEKTGLYFIRSFDYIRFVHTFKKRRASTFSYSDVKRLQAYLVGVILSAEVMGQKFYWELKNRRKLRTATNKRDVACQSKVFSEIPKYYGLSLKTIAAILGCKETRASVLKNAAADAGYIKVRHRFAEYKTLTKADFDVRNNLNDLFPQLKGKIRIKAVSVKGLVEYKVLVQLHDEIIPKLRFKILSKFNNLNISTAIVRHIDALRKVA